MDKKTDKRNINSGFPIPKEHYCDQPYVIVREDGAWVVCLTTGSGIEGDHGQHVISSISYDQGKSWTKPIDIESAESPESSWVMPYLTPYGRIYAFYVYNNNNMRTVHSTDEEGFTTRVDTLGVMAYKFSDDGGESWSKERYYIPIRNFEIDNQNPYNGEVQLNSGDLFCTFRTVLGHNCHAYSRDDGKTWTPSEFMTDKPGGRPFKHPRAANFVRKYSNGKQIEKKQCG